MMAWSEESYGKAFEEFIDERPAATLAITFGPYTNKAHKVTPHAVARALPFLEKLVDAGLKTLQVNGSRVESYLIVLLQGRQALVTADGNLCKTANDVATHIVIIAKQLRQMKREDAPCVGDSR
ncbi:hypothetical protein N9L68_01340 [bacterium]|nr:hypothetical protein [bacterium]